MLSCMRSLQFIGPCASQPSPIIHELYEIHSETMRTHLQGAEHSFLVLAGYSSEQRVQPLVQTAEYETFWTDPI